MKRQTHSVSLAVVYCLVSFCTSSLAVPTVVQEAGGSSDNTLWKGSSMDKVVQELKVECTDKNDGVACIKFKVLHLLDEALRKDSFQVSDSVSVVKNDAEAAPAADGEARGFVDQIESYIQTHDMQVRLPKMLGGSTLTISPRNMDNDELTLSLRNGDGVVEGKGRKNKLKKLLVPIVVFILLKAMTLVPLAIGVLGLKAWNALQLSFFSFVISVGLAIFQLCKKIAADSAVPPAQIVSSHAPWDPYNHYAAARNFFMNHPFATAIQPQEVEAQQMAYRAYGQ